MCSWLFTLTLSIIIVSFLSRTTFSTIEFKSTITWDMFYNCFWLIYPLLWDSWICLLPYSKEISCQIVLLEYCSSHYTCLYKSWTYSTGQVDQESNQWALLWPCIADWSWNTFFSPSDSLNSSQWSKKA